MFLDTKNNKFEIMAMKPAELDSNLILQWSDLEQRAVEGNAYLSPHFILPAVKYLTPDAEVLFIFVKHITANTKKMVGAGVFEYVHGTRSLPLPHLRAYRSPHSYLSGLLVDEEFVDSALAAFFTFFSNFKRSCCGVEFVNRTRDTRLSKQIEIAASKLNISWSQYNEKKRAVLIPGKLGSEYVNEVMSAKMKKTLRYGRNLLGKTGEIHWKIVRGHEIEAGCVDNFLKLENMGWKGSNKTSLLSNANDEFFFREMITRFAKEGRAFFTELTVNGRTIASTSNLLSAKMGYAFKIGWDPEFTASSPGILNEVEFIKNATGLFSYLEYIDSGADEGSFIEKLWTDSYKLVSGLFVTRLSARPVAAFAEFARRMKQRFHKSEN